MKIALIGYGKMGKAIEEIAKSKGHEIVLAISHLNEGEMTKANLQKSDVAIEFTRPEAAYANIMKCFEANVPVVCGTTGWLDRMEDVKEKCMAEEQSFFYASNYSVGVNILFELNSRLAQIMNRHPQYKALIEEVHHVHKLDSPSGTALSLAKDLMKENKKLTEVKDYDLRKDERPSSVAKGELPIISMRLKEIPGTHRVIYQGPDDDLMIMHHAKSRRGFAEGAVVAAEWLIGKKGVFGMKDLLNF